MQTPGKYDDSGLGSPVFTKREQKLKEQKPREELRLTCPMDPLANPAVCCVTLELIKTARYMLVVTNCWLLVLILANAGMHKQGCATKSQLTQQCEATLQCTSKSCCTEPLCLSTATMPMMTKTAFLQENLYTHDLL